MTTPHDKLFRQVFARRDEAAAVLRSVLPAEVGARIEWSSLTAMDAHYVDQELADRQSDLVFTARMGSESALVYVLFEHQSSSDEMMAFRLLVYAVRVLENWRKDNSHLPAGRHQPGP